MKAASTSRALALTLLLVAGRPTADTHARPTAEPARSACLTAYEAGQEERATRRLLAARAHLVTCGGTSCPSAMQRECLAWLAEVDAATPTVVVRGKLPGGEDTAAVRVLVDGEEIAARLDGGAIPIDPGEHRFRFEHPPFAPIERVVVVTEGERLHNLDVAFGDGSVPSPRPAWPMFALGGVAAVSLTTFAVLGASGVSRYDALKTSCAPNCSPSATSDVRTRLAGADVSLAIGLASLGGAAFLFFTRPRPAPQVAGALRFDITPMPQGLFGTGRLTF